MNNELINPVEMGVRIKKQRLLLGYSREKLAEMIGVTPRYCYDIELGLKNMSTQILYNLSLSLNVSTDYLLFGQQKNYDLYTPILSLIKACPQEQLGHLEAIISHYLQALRESTVSDKEI